MAVSVLGFTLLLLQHSEMRVTPWFLCLLPRWPKETAVVPPGSKEMRTKGSFSKPRARVACDASRLFFVTVGLLPLSLGGREHWYCQHLLLLFRL